MKPYPDAEPVSNPKNGDLIAQRDRSLMSRDEKHLLKKMGQAIHDFDLIQEGDRIMVAVSGGKDSLSLLRLLMRMQKRAPIHFTLVAVNLDQGQPNFPVQVLEDWFRGVGVEYRIVKKDTYSIVKRLTQPGKTYCAVCSRLRRAILYSTAMELGATKIALGHHREDLIETLLLSAFYAGALKSMPAKLRSDDGRNTIIRPLVYCPESALAAYAQEQRLPILPCGLCESQENQQRKQIKKLIANLAVNHPAVPGNLLNALGNVVPSHLLDPSVHKDTLAADQAEARLEANKALRE
jgi:tRNA 2-thiocytidine biosynthesis protein TtcA